MDTSSSRPSLWQVALHLFLMASVSLALPLFDVLSDRPAFFVAHGSKPEDLWALAAILCVLAPLAMFVAVVLMRVVGVRGSTWLAGFFVSCLSALYVLRVLNAVLEPSPVVAIGAATLASVAFGWLYVRARNVQLLLSVLSPASLVIPAIFLFHGPASEIRAGSTPKQPRPPLEIEHRPPIIVVVLDELPLISLLDAAGRIDESRFPNFARLADMSTWFRKASTVSDSTPGSITAILTGKNVKKGNLAVWNRHPTNLFSLLGDAYAFNVWEINTQFLSPALHRAGAPVAKSLFSQRMFRLLVDGAVVYAHLVTPVELRGALPSLEGGWQDLAKVEPPGLLRKQKGWHDELFGAERGQVVRNFIASIDAEGPPTLHFLHTMLPHTPWVYLPSGKQHGPVRTSQVGLAQNASAKIAWEEGPESRMRRWHQRHLLQVAFVDSLIGELLDHLDREQILEEALLVITSDHGRAFIVGDEHRTPTPRNHGEVLFVPLFIKLPGRSNGETSDLNAQTIDIVPSVADLLGVKLPWDVDGVSLFSTGPRPGHRYLFSVDAGKMFYRDEETRTRLLASLGRNTRRFDLDRPDHGLFRFGRFRDAMGRRVDQLPRDEAELVVRLERPAPGLIVDANAGVLPAQVEGLQISPSNASTRASLAISVNGIIQAVAEVERPCLRFEAILPEEALRDGANDLAIHLIERDDDGALRLHGPARIAEK